MSILKEMYNEEERQEQSLLDNWATYNERNEKLISRLEKKVSSDRYERLKESAEAAQEETRRIQNQTQDEWLAEYNKRDKDLNK